jgi:hypothetical protein
VRGEHIRASDATLHVTPTPPTPLALLPETTKLEVEQQWRLCVRAQPQTRPYGPPTHSAACTAARTARASSCARRAAVRALPRLLAVGSRRPVHDSLTQRLRLRVLIKEIAKERAVLGGVEVPLADLRLNAPAARAVVVPLAGRRDPALLHLRLTYSLFHNSPAH